MQMSQDCRTLPPCPFAAPRGRACRRALNLGRAERATRRSSPAARLSVSARRRRVVLSGHAATSALIAADNLEQQHSKLALFLLGRDMQSFCNAEVRVFALCSSFRVEGITCTLSDAVSHLRSGISYVKSHQGAVTIQYCGMRRHYPCVFANVRCSLEPSSG